MSVYKTSIPSYSARRWKIFSAQMANHVAKSGALHSILCEGKCHYGPCCAMAGRPGGRSCSKARFNLKKSTCQFEQSPRVTPPRSDGSVAIGSEILRCDQDDRAGPCWW